MKITSFFLLKKGTFLTDEAFACLDCGLVWSSTDASELRGFIQENCKNDDSRAS
jgi:hypothetical protein